MTRTAPNKVRGPRAAGSTRYGIRDALRELHTYRMPFARNNGETHPVIGVVALVIGTTLFPKDIKCHPWKKIMPKVDFRQKRARDNFPKIF